MKANVFNSEVGCAVSATALSEEVSRLIPVHAKNYDVTSLSLDQAGITRDYDSLVHGA